MTMPDPPRPIWCLAVDCLGTKHFHAFQPLFCFPPLWSNWGAKLRVLGRARDTYKVISVVLSTDRMANWRVEQVSDFAIIRRFWDAWDGSEESRATAEMMVAAFKTASGIKPILTRRLPYIEDTGIDP